MREHSRQPVEVALVCANGGLGHGTITLWQFQTLAPEQVFNDVRGGDGEMCRLRGLGVSLDSLESLHQGLREGIRVRASFRFFDSHPGDKAMGINRIFEHVTRHRAILADPWMKVKIQTTCANSL